MIRILASAMAATCLLGCASVPPGKALDLGSVISDPATYDGQRIIVVACVNVTIHGVALLPCGERHPNVDIKGPEARASEYSRLVAYAHKNMGASPEELPVLVAGRFMAASSTGEALHFVFVERFQPEKGL